MVMVGIRPPAIKSISYLHIQGLQFFHLCASNASTTLNEFGIPCFASPTCPAQGQTVKYAAMRTPYFFIKKGDEEGSSGPALVSDQTELHWDESAKWVKSPFRLGDLRVEKTWGWSGQRSMKRMKQHTYMLHTKYNVDPLFREFLIDTLSTLSS